MKIDRRSAILGLAGMTVVPSLSAAVAKGDKAPDVELESTKGGKEKLSAYRGKKNVVLAFFPKAFTGGCTKEMTGYQTGIDKFTDAETVVFGVSTDDVETNKKFAESLKLQFALLSDPTGAASKAFGILNEERKVANRTTFVIDKQGVVQEVITGADAIAIDGAAMACSRLKKS
jgi:peroxiredoxin Q/BCP